MIAEGERPSLVQRNHWLDSSEDAGECAVVRQELDIPGCERAVARAPGGPCGAEHRIEELGYDRGCRQIPCRRDDLRFERAKGVGYSVGVPLIEQAPKEPLSPQLQRPSDIEEDHWEEQTYCGWDASKLSRGRLARCWVIDEMLERVRC